jgi:subfamily B ATP-binding cassette protein MsbA
MGESTHTAAAPKTSPDWNIYRRLLAYVVPMWPYFLVALVGYGLGNGAEAYFARLFGDVVEALAKPAADDWLRFPLLMMATVLVRGLGDFAGDFFLSRVSYRVVHVLRTQLFDQLLRMPSAYFDRSAKGHLVSRITFNVIQLRDTATDALKSIVQDGSKVAVLLGAMLWANWRLTAIFIVIAPVVAIIVAYASSRFRNISRRIQNSMGDVTHVASEAVNAYRVVRTFGGESYERMRFEKSSRANQRQNLKMVVTKASSTEIIQVFVAGALALLIGLLFQPRIAGSMSPGDVVYFVGLAGLLARPIKKLSEVNSRLQRGLAAAEDIFEQLDQETERDDGKLRVDRVAGRIEFRGVSFGYESGSGEALRGIDVTIEPGQRVALVGRSGAGKSTLASLIPRFYEPTGGAILLDGKPLTDYALQCLRDQIALVTQQVVLFNDTLERNIAYGRLTDSKPDAVWNAVTRAHADGFIEALPAGLSTVVGDDGVLLSGGQRQRVAIARALLKDAPILILDEATSSLDPESEQYVRAALDEVMRGRTTLVIAHRLSTIEHADMILVLDDGRIVERGTHAELLSRGGTYAELYASQFADRPPIDRRRVDTRHSVQTQADDSMPRPTTSRWRAPVRLGNDAASAVVRGWYSDAPWLAALAPFARIYQAVVRRRRFRYLSGRAARWRAPVPVIVVGNITVGGTGKTPFVIWLAEWLRGRGFEPGIVSRGYRGRRERDVLSVDANTDPIMAGDEAPLLAARTGCPVVVAGDRIGAVQQLLQDNACDVVISDDGLQHYALVRDIEIVVVDAERRFGNGRCLPAGPLREPIARLEEVDFVVANGAPAAPNEWSMAITPRAFVKLRSGERLTPDAFVAGQTIRVHAVAGIGNPQRFFDTLDSLGIDVDARPLPDHHVFVTADVAFADGLPVVVTEKDAVKIRTLGESDVPAHVWYLEIDASLSPAAERALAERLSLRGITPHRHTVAEA